MCVCVCVRAICVMCAMCVCLCCCVCVHVSDVCVFTGLVSFRRTCPHHRCLIACPHHSPLSWSYTEGDLLIKKEVFWLWDWRNSCMRFVININNSSSSTHTHNSTNTHTHTHSHTHTHTQHTHTSKHTHSHTHTHTYIYRLFHQSLYKTASLLANDQWQTPK